MKAIFLSILFVMCGLLCAPHTAHAQTTKVASQIAVSPEEVVRSFYAWYLGELNRDNWEPLKDRREALKYLTPEFHRRAPRIIEKEMADIFICAQDWDASWGQNYTVGRASLRGQKATVVVRLPIGDGLAIKIKTTLIKRGGEWRINATDCVN